MEKKIKNALVRRFAYTVDFFKNEESSDDVGGFFAKNPRGWSVVEEVKNGIICFFVESGGHSSFFMEKFLEISGFIRKKNTKKKFFWACFFVTSILQCG